MCGFRMCHLSNTETDVKFENIKQDEKSISFVIGYPLSSKWSS